MAKRRSATTKARRELSSSERWLVQALSEIRGLSRGPVDGDMAKQMGQVADEALSRYEEQLEELQP